MIRLHAGMSSGRRLQCIFRQREAVQVRGLDRRVGTQDRSAAGRGTEWQRKRMCSNHSILTWPHSAMSFQLFCRI